MTGGVEMLKRVRVRRILAASDMATGKTYTKLVPLLPKRAAFLTAACARRYLSNLAYMFAMIGHLWHIGVVRLSAGLGHFGRRLVFSAHCQPR